MTGGTSSKQRAASFGRVVTDYERGRPGYPEEAVRWLIGDARHIVDLGAGTGKLTSSLIEPGRRVVALEPQEPMVRLLDATVEGAFAVCACAEALPVGSEWADLVVVAQAFHWFDQERALPEIARVLRSGGRLSLVWNVRNETVGWVAELSRIAGRDNSSSTRARLDGSPLFEPFESRKIPTVQILDGDSLLAQIRSRSNVAAMPESDRAEVMKSIAHLCATHPELAGKHQIEFPYVTEAYRAVKK